MVLLLAGLLGLASAARAGIGLRAGLWYGTQNVNESKINAVYGAAETFVALPYIEARFGAGWTLGAGYEFGYDRKGLFVPYDCPAEFRMSGLNILAGYELRTGRVAVFAQVGIGLYAYKQTVANPSVTDMPVDARKTTAVAAAGIKVYPTDFLFLGLEARYVPLKVKPYESEVDLGGWRFAAGAGFAFGSR